MEVGGYFEIENSNISVGNLHPSAIKLNTGRNCLEYILQAQGYKKIYIPFYTCEVILQPIKKLNINFEFYYINENLEPTALPLLLPDEVFLYTNYFGIKSSYITNELSKFSGNLIIDNCQALFEPTLKNADSFYSLRKFAGVADGAFAYCSKKLNMDLMATANSNERNSHLYIRKELGAQSGYNDFIANEKALSDLPIQKMSISTTGFIGNYDFEKNKTIRLANFLYLYSQLKEINTLKINLDNLNGPMCFPLLPVKRSAELKRLLISEKIYVPTFWPNVTEWLHGLDCFEVRLSNNLICLPIDQRYSFKHMEFILKKFLHLYEKN